MQRIIIGVSGASGMPLALTLLQALHDMPDVQTHVIISAGAEKVLQAECGLMPAQLHTLAHTVYAADDMTAPPASGSWRHKGMLVCPCSMATLAAIATGVGTNLLHRAADVCLKERFPLVLVTRETPLSPVHTRNMCKAQKAGAIIMPPCLPFYSKPRSVQDMLQHFVGRMLDQLAIAHTLSYRWGEKAPIEGGIL